MKLSAEETVSWTTFVVLLFYAVHNKKKPSSGEYGVIFALVVVCMICIMRRQTKQG